MWETFCIYRITGTDYPLWIKSSTYLRKIRLLHFALLSWKWNICTSNQDKGLNCSLNPKICLKSYTQRFTILFLLLFGYKQRSKSLANKLLKHTFGKNGQPPNRQTFWGQPGAVELYFAIFSTVLKVLDQLKNPK